MKLTLVSVSLSCLALFCSQQGLTTTFAAQKLRRAQQVDNSDFDDEQVAIPFVEEEEPLIDFVPEQDCIPEVEAVLQEDGTYAYEEVKSCPDQVFGPGGNNNDDDSNVDEEQIIPVVEEEEPWIDIVDEQDCIPEVEAVLQEDGTYVYEEVKSCPEQVFGPGGDNDGDSNVDEEQIIPVVEEEEPLIDIVEEQDCIPEVEAVLQEDGTYVYEEVKSCPEQVFGPGGNNNDDDSNVDEEQVIPVVEEEEPLIDIVEEQDCIPEVEAVLQEDGTYVYEEVKSCPEDEPASDDESDSEEPVVTEPVEEPVETPVETPVQKPVETPVVSEPVEEEKEDSTSKKSSVKTSKKISISTNKSK